MTDEQAEAIARASEVMSAAITMAMKAAMPPMIEAHKAAGSKPFRLCMSVAGAMAFAFDDLMTHVQADGVTLERRVEMQRELMGFAFDGVLEGLKAERAKKAN